MDDVVDIGLVEDIFAEHGLSDVSVQHYHEPARDCDVIRVRKKVDKLDEPDLGAEMYFTYRELQDEQGGKWLIERKAEETARSLKEELYDDLSWGEVDIMVEPTEFYSATCKLCGAEASIDVPDDRHVRRSQPITIGEIASSDGFTTDVVELSIPAIRLYLLGKLRGECKQMCPNSSDRSDRKI